MAARKKHKGNIVTAAGTGINLALGVLYAWSIFKAGISQSIQKGDPGGFKWDQASLNDPYAVCCMMFACSMILAGTIQDKFGPRRTAVIGGVLVSTGFLWISQTTDYLSWVIGFGVLAGAGIAFGYSAATPSALKWFPANKTGRISGIVVAGFGLAPVYIAPLGQYLLNTLGLMETMMVFGLAFFLAVSVLSLFLVNPPANYAPPGFVERRGRSTGGKNLREQFKDRNVSPLKMIREPAFWLLWFLYFIGAGAGLMVIGSVAGMAKASLGANAFLAVGILAIGNAGGRIAAGTLSDKIGRKRTLFAIFLLQALLMFVAVPIIGAATATALLILVLATLIGFNYGANLALFPSFSKDLWGLKNFGVNYGVLFTAWGFGGLVMGRASETLMARTGSFAASFVTAGMLLLIGTGIIIFMKDRKDELRRQNRRSAGNAAPARS